MTSTYSRPAALCVRPSFDALLTVARAFVTLRWLLLPVLLFAVPLSVQAQQSEGDCEVSGGLSMDENATSESSATPSAKHAAVTVATPATTVSPSTDAEAYVQDVIEEEGLHVVHFWAPWCSNSKSELANGWAELVGDNPDVTFTFVTVWNDGEKGPDVLDNNSLPDRVTEVAQPDLGPSNDESNRRRSFLSLPVTWIPSTWIFHNSGELAFALNYGEMDMSTIQSLLDTTRKDW